MENDSDSAESFRPDAPAQVLLVDDHPGNLQVLGAILQDLPCTLRCAASGEEALRHILKTDVALILLDVNMPGMSGLETAGLIRARGRTRHIPIIFISADITSSPKLQPQGYDLGAVDYILKPVDPATLRAKVMVFIDLHAKRAELARQKRLLLQSQRYTRSLVDANLDALLITDPLGTITDVNPQAEALTALGRDDLIGTPLARHFTAPAEVAALVEQVLAAGRVTDYELVIRAPDGRETVVSCNATTFRRPDGSLQGVFVAARDTTERKLIEDERVSHQQRVAELSRRLVAVQEEERRRLSGVVHDGIGPNLVAAKINLDAIHARIPAPLRAELDARFDDMRALLDDAVSQMRDVSTELRPAVLDYAGLVPAIESYARQFSARTGTAVRVLADPATGRLPSELESVLFRIVQEALHNCAKHAQATRVQIEVRRDGRSVCLAVNDDGIGFVPESVSGLGLLTMRERAEFAGGRFSIESEPGQGTRMRVEIRSPEPHPC